MLTEKRKKKKEVHNGLTILSVQVNQSREILLTVSSMSTDINVLIKAAIITSMDFSANFFLSCLILSILGTCTSTDTISPGRSIRDGDTIVSANEIFELGFFSPGSSTRRYIGIWYKKVSAGTVVWVANRETPVFGHSGVLYFTDRGVLVLRNSTTHVVWSSNATRTSKSPVAQLMDSGNFVVRNGNDNNPENYLWQSFDYPTDTNLPGMKLGRNFVTGMDWTISSWKSVDDPAKGEYSCGIDPRGFPQLVFKKGSEIQYRAGSWNGKSFSGASRQIPNAIYRYEFVLNEKEVYYNTELLNKSVVSRLVVNASGISMRLTWIDQQHGWASYFATGEDQCGNYAKCGPNAKCNSDNAPVCSCLEGFEPKSARDWSFYEWAGGCVRKNTLVCGRGEGFVKHRNMKLPDTSNSWFNMNISLKECKELCLKNCSCMAYTNSDIRNGGSGCLHWFNDLVDMRQFADFGQDIYIRMAASYIDKIRRERQLVRSKKIGFIVLSFVLIIGLLILGYLLYVRKRKLKIREKKNISEIDYRNPSGKQDLDLPIINLTAIRDATNNFSSSNKLGEGGFGPVYKGILVDGQEVAVKRLSVNSGQGLQEFKNEVLLIAKLQHRNLVKLLGCCIEGDETMLIYEYMPNKSLDCFIFDETKSKLLDWPTRISIISSIARGLLYLHQDSRLRIIHRDLKASNVLLDNDMNPKISDFGMARTFGGDQIEANTRRVVGTYGYMSPEYAVDGHFSAKSDVYSFGVLVLEIVSGKKNRGFNHPHHHHNLVGHAWILWNEGRPLQLINEVLSESSVVSQILRCVHVGLLCVQQKPEDRPNMSSVVLMLDSEISMPQPNKPGFFTERTMPDLEGESSSSKQKLSSSCDITMSKLEPR